MNNQKVRVNKFALLYPLIFFAATNMLIRSWVPFFHGSWRTLLFGCLLSLIVVPQFRRTKWFMWIVIYAVIITLNWYSGDMLFSSSTIVANEVANLFLFSSVVYYLFNSYDKRCIMWTFWTVFIMVCIAAIGSFYVNQISPEIVRNQSYLVERGEQDILFGYYRLGLSNYLLPHGVSVIIPSLVLLIKQSENNSWLRMIAMLFLALSLVLVYLGGSTTVLLLSLIGLTTFFLRGDTRKDYSIIVIPIVVSLPFLLFPELIIDVMSLFTGEIADTYASHLRDLTDYSSSGKEGNMAHRMDLYAMSLNEFFQNIIYGTNNPMSNHSVILDRLGSLGLLGFLPFVGILAAYIRFVRKHLVELARIYFDITTVVMLIMLFVKGIEDKEIWFMFLVAVPVVLYVAGVFKTTIKQK